MSKLTSAQSLSMCYTVTVGWISQHNNIPSDQVDTSSKFEDFGVSGGAYLQCCNEIIATLNRASGKTMTLSGAWRVQHMDDVILDFIGALSDQLLASPDAPVAIKAADFAINQGKS